MFLRLLMKFVSMYFINVRLGQAVVGGRGRDIKGGWKRESEWEVQKVKMDNQ